MDQLFSSLKNFIKPQSCITDNTIFRLHYKFTVVILIAFSIMVTARQYFGDPIDCISRDDIPSKLLDTFCWIHTTFSIKESWDERVGVEVPYPGVGKTTNDGTKVYHAYYQWVCFVLFFQALFFYIPRYIWKSAEGHRCRSLILGLDNPIMDNSERNNKINLIASYLDTNIKNHDMTFYIHCLAEILNLVNVTIQMIITDRFLGNEFIQYGFNVIKFTEWDWSLRMDPMIKVFPRLTKCTFHRYGSSGDLQKHDAMCILPINIINEKIYIFLWFWFVFLFFASIVGLLNRAATILSTRFRAFLIKIHCRFIDENNLFNIIRSTNVGDWFILHMLSKNMDPINFSELVNNFNNILREKKMDKKR